MRSSVVLTLPLAALALAQSSDSAAYVRSFAYFSASHLIKAFANR